MSEQKKSDFSVTNLGEGSVLGSGSTAVNPALEQASLLFQMAPGMSVPYEYSGVKDEIRAYRTSAWIGTTLMISPVYDVYGKDAVKFLNSIAVNDFSKLGMNGLRHAILCNDKGQIMTDGVVIRIGEDRYRTYWLDPVISYLISVSDMEVYGEDMTGREYFIQISGERSLEILENALEADLHDIRFARHRKQEVDGRSVEVIRLGMSGNLAYEIHGPIEDYAYIYKKVWASGEKYNARKLGMHTYNNFNHTEAGFPNINLHYPLPIFESDEGMTKYMSENPAASSQNINRKLLGSVGDDIQIRFVTPYDVGWGFLVNFNHEFTGRAALEKISVNPSRTVTTLEWNAEDVASVFATMLMPGVEPCDDITPPSDISIGENSFYGHTSFRADKVFCGEEQVGIAVGRIISYTYNSMISLSFINSAYAKEGTELEILWGTPGTPQKVIRAKVARFPYNKDLISNDKRNVEDIPRYVKK